MFGTNLSRVFRSRWTALWWSLSMLFTAWQIVSVADPEDRPPAQQAAARPAQPANPWAK